MKDLPNFLIIGAQKAGTTWLRHRLMQHPDIFMSAVKEVNYFTKSAHQRVLQDYARNFEDGASFRYRGEATPGYFWTFDDQSEYCSIDREIQETDIAGAVRRTLGESVKLVVSLRHPVHRAVSAYFHHYKMGRVHQGQSILEFGKRSGIIDMGFYARHLRAWEKVFGKDKVFVVFFDDIEKQPVQLLESVFKYLELAPCPVSGADTADHVGLKLAIEDNALVVDLEDEHTAKIIKRRRLGNEELPVVRRKELLALQRLYRPTMEFLEKRFGRQDLNWLKPVELADFAEGAGPSVEASGSALGLL